MRACLVFDFPYPFLLGYCLGITLPFLGHCGI